MRYATYCAACAIASLIIMRAYVKRLERKYHKTLGH